MPLIVRGYKMHKELEAFEAIAMGRQETDVEDPFSTTVWALITPVPVLLATQGCQRTKLRSQGQLSGGSVQDSAEVPGRGQISRPPLVPEWPPRLSRQIDR